VWPVPTARQAIRGKGSILEQREIGQRRQEGNPAGMGGGARDGGPLGLGVRRDTGCGRGPERLVALYCALSLGRVDEAVCGEWQQGMRMSETDKSFEAAGLQGKAHNGSRTIVLVEI
jgi:hypothetical protein